MLYPSGFDLATNELPIWPPTPALNVTIKGCFNGFGRSSLSTLALASEDPPGGFGTIKLMGLLGYGSSAKDVLAMKALNKTANNFIIFTDISSLFFYIILIL
jgi:hypothetical protein